MNQPANDMRARILVAATRLFAARGFDGTSVQAVASAVGIRKASLLYHFPSKDALRRAVLDGLLARWKDIVPQILRAATAGDDTVGAVISEVVDFFRADPDRARLLTREVLDRPEEMRSRIQEHLSPWMGLVTTAVRRGVEQGLVRPGIDPEAWVVEMVTLLVGTFALSGATVDILGGVELGADAQDRRLREVFRIARASLLIDGDSE